MKNLQTITTDGRQRHVLLLRREERRCAKTNSQRMTRIQLTAPERVSGTSQQNARKNHTVLHHNGAYPAFGIGPARWPSSPSPSEAAHWFSLIPVSGVGVGVGGVSEVVGEEKMGGNGVEGMFSKVMTDDKMTFEARQTS